MKQCDRCGQTASDESKFCLKCGAPLPEIVPDVSGESCPNCQNPVGPAEKFCGNCGFAVQASGPAQESQNEVPKEEGSDANEMATESEDEVREESQKEADDQKDTQESPQTAAAIAIEETPPPTDAEDTPEKVTPESDEKPAEESPAPEDDDISDTEEVPSQDEDMDAAAATLADDDASKPATEDAPAQDNTRAEAKPATVFCPRCGTKNNGTAAFCRNCGHNLKRKTSSAAAAAMAPAMAPPPPAYMPPPAPAAYAPPPTPPKKKSKAPLIIGLIVLLLAIALLVYFFAGPAIRRLFAGPTGTYVALERDHLQEQSEDLSEWLVDMGNRDESATAGGHVFDTSVSLDPSLEMDPVTKSTLENLTWRNRFLYDRNTVPSSYFAGIDLLTYGEPLMSLEGYYDSEQLIVGMPGLLSRHIWVQRAVLDEFLYDAGMDVDVDMGIIDTVLGMDLGIDEAALTASMHDLIEIMLDYVDDVELESDQPLTAGGVLGYYDRYTVTFAEDVAYDMVLALFSALREDEEVYNLFASFFNMNETSFEMGESFSFADWQEEIDGVIEDIEWEKENGIPLSILQEVYVDGDEIVGRDFRIYADNASEPSMQFKDFRPQNEDGQFAVLLSLSGDGDTLTYLNTYWEEGELRNGTLQLSDDWNTLVEIQYSGYQKVTLGSRDYPVGEFAISFPGDEYGEMPSSIRLETSVFNEQFMVSVSVPGFGQIRVGYHEVLEQNVQMPSYSEDQLVNIMGPSPLEQLVTEETMMELMRIMEQLNLDLMDLMLN